MDLFTNHQQTNISTRKFALRLMLLQSFLYIVQKAPRDADAALPTRRCVVATGIPARATSAVLASARAAAPLPASLAHVKRARASARTKGTTEVVVKLASEGASASARGDAESDAAVRADVLERHADVIASVVYADVPAEGPEDRETWEKACAIWPVSLTAPAERETETPSDEEAAYFRKWTKQACEGAKMSGNCAIIVDPARDVEIARGVDESATHPLRHAVIAAVDLAAKRDVAMYPEKEHVEALIEARRMEKLERDALEIAGVGDDAKKRKREVQTKGSAMTEIMGRPYLCTGYDVFLAREPCIMCAMGLVHSRLKRVVFAVCDNINGALSGPSGIRRLHGVRSLNHHYSVFSFDAEEI